MAVDTVLASKGTIVVKVEFVTADPRFYSLDSTSTTLFLPAGAGGLTFPMTFPMQFDSGVVSGRAQITQSGSTSTPCEINIFGPVNDPRIDHYSRGYKLEFFGSLASGDTLTVSTYDRSVILNGTASRYNYQDAYL